MAAPSVGRRSRQRQGVVPYEGIENGGLDLLKTAVMESGMGKELLHDGFFLLPSSGRNTSICFYFIRLILLPSDIYLTHK